MKYGARLVSLALVSISFACESDAPIAADSDSGSTDGAARIDSGGDEDGGRADAGGPGDGGTDVDGGEACTSPGVAELCVRGMPAGDAEELVVGAPVRIQLMPYGCHSSACTVVDEASCSATLDGTTVTVDGGFCIHYEGECVLPDCGGAGFASCDSGATLAAGNYTATYGGLSVSFTVPGTVPFGGSCASVEDEGEVCDPGASACAPGLACCYPCGIPGCDFQCTTPCDEDDPGCVAGCRVDIP